MHPFKPGDLIEVVKQHSHYGLHLGAKVTVVPNPPDGFAELVYVKGPHGVMGWEHSRFRLPSKAKRTNAPNYGGWSEGDVMAELSRYGRVEHDGATAVWTVIRGPFFVCDVSYHSKHSSHVYLEGVFGVGVGQVTHHSPTLPEVMQWAVERWRKLVADSDPSWVEVGPAHPPSLPIASGSAGAVGKTRHVFTGDLGQRTNWTGGYGGRDD